MLTQILFILYKQSFMKKQALTIAMLLAASAMYAQSTGPSAMNSAGGWMAVSGDTYEWSIGEMAVISTYSSSGLIVTQGLLQPVTKTVGVQQTFLTSQMQVFPNPAENLLFLQPTFAAEGTLACVLHDVAGKIILRDEWNLKTGKEQQQLDLHAIAAGTYILRVSFAQGNQVYTAPYKIQKLQ
jgi:hypothetical protein